MDKQTAGKRGEALALEYFLKLGWRLLEKNYRAGHGEIDLILEDGECTVFVEVKARTGDRFGLGREAVTKRKQGILIRTALYYMQENGLMDAPVRFDVAEVDLVTEKTTHIASAFHA